MSIIDDMSGRTHRDDVDDNQHERTHMSANDGGARRRGSLDRRYVEALARGDAEGAAAVVDEARRRNLTVEQIYLHLLAPALVEIGARWKARRLSVADEHLASEITLAEMERLRERLRRGVGNGPRVVLACVEGESHAIGLRMLADFLMIDGWTVEYLGGSVPGADLVDFVARRAPDVVALSVTQVEHLPSLRLVAAALRRSSPAPRILVGGAALRGRARAPETFGIDAVALDARAGVQEARRLAAPARATASAAEDYFESLGRRVQELRTTRGWTQQQLADEAGLDRTYISGLEHGKQNPTIGALLRLARALEAPIDRLVVFDRGA
jgi:methanogenic corrinoid protein MtbC1/DNA-binding XRE family transcriptional regulator